MIFIKYYAIKEGIKPGIYTSWDEAKKQVNGYSGAVYRSFKTEAEAREFMGHSDSSKQSSKKIEKNQPLSEIIVYTDGGSRNHGNVAGGHVKSNDKAAWAYLIVMPDKKVSKSGGEYGATNNRMEIMALIKALQYLDENGKNHDDIYIVSDSKYVLDAIQKGWLRGWKMKGFTRGKNEPLKNRELWIEVDRLLGEFSSLHYSWTKGHASNEGNVFVDELLNKQMNKMKGKKGQTSKVETSFDENEITKPKPKPKARPKVTQSKKPVQSQQPKKLNANNSPKVRQSVDAIKENLRKMGLLDDGE
ncbi:ribonuclease H family protein [Lentilactobacillus sp. Marseille-Q4993]|uniref:ribonuclease H family protein n=1 Tax=Lentilactobacillus sp. Marseille-Q4993 TaxID=3039492 RepID=UPI0024BCC54D|nr:ribonuclease H family protein [Lentilactobacillus sp. Marseille-Q4993]